MHSERDTELLIQCRQGDRPAMDTLVSHYERSVYNVSYRLLGDRDDACEATRIAFIKTFEKIHRMDEQTNFFSWLYRFTVNQSAALLKRRRSVPQVAEMTADIPETEASFPQRQINDHVQQVLMELSSDLRNVLVLKHFTECSYRQIAEILQIPEKKVTSRLYSARQVLKNELTAREVLSI